jgi:hypothetical protein
MKMADQTFIARLAATGLIVKPDDLPRLEALVKDMDRAAALVRGPRSYTEEPMNVFQLPRP